MLNKCILMGRLTKDPVLRSTNSGKSVAGFTIAVDRDFVRAGEEKQTDFIDITCWDRQADFCAKYFTKGMLVALAGRLQQRHWEDKDGNKRVSYEVIASEVHFAERKRDDSGYGNAYASNAPSYANNAPAQQQPAAIDTTGFTELMDDDGSLPF